MFSQLELFKLCEHCGKELVKTLWQGSICPECDKMWFEKCTLCDTPRCNCSC